MATMNYKEISKIEMEAVSRLHESVFFLIAGSLTRMKGRDTRIYIFEK